MSLTANRCAYFARGHALSSRPGEVNFVLDWLADHLAMIMFVSMFFVHFSWATRWPSSWAGAGAHLRALGYVARGFFKLIGLSDIVLRHVGVGLPTIRCWHRSPCSSSWARSWSDQDRLKTCSTPPRSC